MTEDDVQFLLALIDDLREGYDDSVDDFAETPIQPIDKRVERARTILTKYVYRTKEDKLANPRQEELNFNDYRDWHSDPNWSDENDDED